MSALMYTRKSAPRELLVCQEWEKVDTTSFEAQEQLRIAHLTRAIRLYIHGEAVSTCLDGSGMRFSQLIRAFRRCIACDAAGRQIGWKGLLKHLRVNTAERTKPLVPSGRNGRGGLTGALQLLFKQRNSLHEAFDIYLLKAAKRVPGHEARLRHKSAHQKFVELCREAGLEAEDTWPFNTKKLGKGAIHTYVEDFLSSHFDEIVETQFGNKAKAKSNTGRGFASRLTAPRPLDVVELDEHRCHFIGSIGIPTPGGMLWVPGARVTIILAVERTFGTILAYKAVFSREADADDVLDVLAMVCGIPRDHLLDPETQPSAKAAFPVDLGGPLARCGFNELLLDNALIHLAWPVVVRARAIIGFDVNFGPVKRFERRALNEGAFGALEKHGFHRLQSTTGTDPSDPRRQNPEVVACEQKLSVPRSLDLIEAVASDYNGVISKSGFGMSRLGRMKAWADDVDGFGMIFPELPPVPEGVADLDTTLVPVTICGNQKKGRRPYVYFEEEEYFGPELADRWDLLGKKAFVRARRSNIRQVDLYMDSGIKVDTVTVRGRWARSPAHSRDIRRVVNRAVRDGQLRVAHGEDPVHCFMESLRDSLGSSKSIGLETRRALAAVADEQKHLHEKSSNVTSVSAEAPARFDRSFDSRTLPERKLLRLDDLRAIRGLKR